MGIISTVRIMNHLQTPSYLFRAVITISAETSIISTYYFSLFFFWILTHLKSNFDTIDSDVDTLIRYGTDIIYN